MNLGALDDPRTKEEKMLDYTMDEIASSGQPVWKEQSTQSFVGRYPIRDQDGSSSCVAQTGALILGIENLRDEGRFIEFSAKNIYVKRTNSGGGMIGNEALEIICSTGSTLESIVPSQNMGEEEINRKDNIRATDDEIGKIFRGGGYVHTAFDIDSIATVMETYRKNGIVKPLMVWFRFPRKEWNSIPQVTTSKTDMVHHSVTAIDYCLINGKKHLVIQDSWGSEHAYHGLRFISQEYIKARMTFSVCILDLDNLSVEKPIPTGKITKTLKFGMRDKEVKILQDILKSKGFLKPIETTEYFGGMTLNAVKKFQKSHNLLVDGICGKLTIDKLYE